MAASGDHKGWMGRVLKGWRMGWGRLWRTEAQPNLLSGSQAPLIQRVACQAHVTFPGSRDHSSALCGVACGSQEQIPPDFAENLSKLKILVAQVHAEDLCIAPRETTPKPLKPHLPRVTYMHICDTDGFSLSVFLLQRDARIPLHDHPGMHGVLKVLYGTIRISCMDQLEVGGDQCPGAESQLFQTPLQQEALRPAVFRSQAEYTEASGPCILTPHLDNLHQIEAVDGPAAFLDILAPPYNTDQGRECRYYRVLDPLRPKEASSSASDLPREVWLLETPKDADFWGEEEPYPGPKVLL
nr:2-aminoethanethiol dioxygenase-like [Castor canadensis]